MNRRRVVAFCQPASKPRYQVRETCTEFTDLPGLFISWAARAQSFMATSTSRKFAHSAKTTKTKQEPWRLPRMMPEPITPVKPQRPAAFDPDLRPTRERILFPWEASMSDIEWAVSAFLAKEHPEIHDKLLELALTHSGLLEGDADGGAGTDKTA